MEHQQNRKPTAAWKATLLLSGLIFVILAVEVALRVFGIRFDASLYNPDPVLGWSLRPGSHGWNVSEGQAYIRINSHGARDRERTLAKPPNTFRVAVLGDSATEARQVEIEQTFCGLLEKSLPSCSAIGGKQVEVLNFGVPGYSTAQELLMLRTRVWEYQPDFIVLQTYLGNDLFDNYRRLDFTKPGGRPYYVCNSGPCTLDNSFTQNAEVQPGSIYRHNLLADIMNMSRFLMLVNSRLANMRQRRQLLQASARGPATGPVPGISADYAAWLAYAKPDHPDLLGAWQATEGTLLLFRDEVRAHHLDFLVISFPMVMQIYPDLAARATFAKRHDISLDYQEKRLAEFAAANGIPLISAADRLSRYAVEHHAFVAGFPNTKPGEGHLNVIGHQLIAEMIQDNLCGRLSTTKASR